jgi:hypothetical protein
VAATELKNGEKFTLYDGWDDPGPVTFVFRDWPSSTTTDIKIAGSAADMATAIWDAINKQPRLRIQAMIDPRETTRVLLTHVFRSSYGNQRISETVADDSFKVKNMSGGNAGDCLEGVGCTSTDDCTPGLRCVNRTCVR